MDSRDVWFVVETREECDRLSATFPGRILLCDRTFIQDTQGSKKHVEGTSEFHEIRSAATTVPTCHPRVWPVIVSDLPCNCQHCIVDQTNDKCIFLPWRKTHSDKMRIECVAPDEADSWVNSAVTRTVKGQREYGVIVNFVPDLKTWNVSFSFGQNESFNYSQMCKIDCWFKHSPLLPAPDRTA